MSPLLCFVAATLVVPLGVPQTQLRVVSPSQKVEVADERRSFGYWLVAQDDTLIVADPSFDEAGGAIVYQRDAKLRWHERQVLRAPDPKSNDQYSSSLALVGDTLAVSEWLDDDVSKDSGAVFIYRRGKDGTFHQTQKIPPPSAARTQYFGINVALTQKTLAVAWGSGSAGPRPIAFYQRNRSGVWTHRETLIPDKDSPRQYGLGLYACEDFIIASMNHADDRGEDSGAVLILARGQSQKWQVVQRIAPEDLGPRYHFGSGFHTDCKTLALSTSRAKRSGRVYVYSRGPDGSFELVHEIDAPVSGRDDDFARPVYVRGDRLIVGAPRTEDRGTAHLYYRVPETGRFHYAKTLSVSGLAYAASFGQGIVLTENQAIIGAPGYGPDGIYVFDLKD